MKKTVKSLAYKVLGTTLLASALIGCGATDQNSETKVTNGTAIGESTYPSVVLLVMNLAEGQAICTGTFVNDSQVITAGHCVEGLSKEAPELYYATKKVENGTEKFVLFKKAISFQRNPAYSIDLGVNPNDVSVVTFPANSAPAVSTRASVSPKAGQKLTIVGYGNNVNSFDSAGHLTGSGAGTKRVGTNVIASVSDGFINFNGLPEANGKVLSGTQVASGSGDSGGPLFVDGQLAGITSGGGLSPNSTGGYVAVSKYVDLNSSYVKSFVASALKN